MFQLDALPSENKTGLHAATLKVYYTVSRAAQDCFLDIHLCTILLCPLEVVL